MNKYIVLAIILVIFAGGYLYLFQKSKSMPEPVACTLEAKICPDGTAVGRTGPDCEFQTCPAFSGLAYNDLIRVFDFEEGQAIESPLTIKGEARGNWFFEASFPVVITDWDGKIIVTHYASAQGEWMTENFVPFEAVIEFESPYGSDDPDFMKRGVLILQKDNPSGLPEHDDAFEIPMEFR